jgi:serine/threonine protein phosphatase PrpC
MAAAIRESIAEINAYAVKQWPFQGCTLAIVVIADQTIFTANVGDSRIILVSGGTARRLSVDHHVSNPEERQAVIDRGGYIVNDRVNNSLALTRSIGDGCLADSISGEPHTDSVPFDPEFGLIIACDGVWDVTTDDEAAAMFVAATDPGAAARLIKDHAIEHGSSDNVSAICLSCKPKEE